MRNIQTNSKCQDSKRYILPLENFLLSGIKVTTIIPSMSDKRRLVYSIIQFCQKELQADDLSDDAKESLEVVEQP